MLPSVRGALAFQSIENQPDCYVERDAESEGEKRPEEVGERTSPIAPEEAKGQLVDKAGHQRGEEKEKACHPVAFGPEPLSVGDWVVEKTHGGLPRLA